MAFTLKGDEEMIEDLKEIYFKALGKLADIIDEIGEITLNEKYKNKENLEEILPKINEIMDMLITVMQECEERYISVDENEQDE